MWALKAPPPAAENKRKIVTLATEHACVLDTVEWLGAQGFEIDILPVQPDGLLSLDLAADRIDESTGLVATMLVNNEIGVIQPSKPSRNSPTPAARSSSATPSRRSAASTSPCTPATWSPSRPTKCTVPRG
jgi:hypothetical protein